MSAHHGWKRFLAVIVVFVGVWLILRYLFPLFLPFLFGLAVALPAEKSANFLQKKLHLGPGGACFAAVTGVLGALSCIFALAGGFLIRRAAALARSAGAAAAGLTEDFSLLRDRAAELASMAPAPLAEPLRRSLDALFSDGSALLDRGTGMALDLAGHAAQHVPGLLMLLGTAVLSAYLICPRLPALRRKALSSSAWQRTLRPALSRLFHSGAAWLRAQLKLSAVTFAIVLCGFFLLGVRNKLAMAALTAAVDAIPLLGTGTVLLPWALISVLGGEPVRAVGLLGVYVTALLIRSALEPRLVGRQLGLDPLAALVALYTGYRLWGFGGMILAPILTVTARELWRSEP